MTSRRPSRLLLISVAILAIMLPLAACGGGGGGAAQEPGVIEVKDNFFNPKTTDIHTGDTVTWKWVGAVDHNVQGPGFGSPTQGSGKTFQQTFTKAGDVNFICTIHAGMAGTVRVKDK